MNAAPLHSINSAVISQQSHPTQTDHPFSMQPMHIRLPWFSDQDKIRRHSWIEATRLTLISIPGFTQVTQPWSLSSVTRCSATFSLSFFHVINFVGLVDSVFHGIIFSRLYSMILNVIKKCAIHCYKLCMSLHGVGPPLAIINLLGKLHFSLLTCTLLKPRVKY
jgi:hypothetical protein